MSYSHSKGDEDTRYPLETMTAESDSHQIDGPSEASTSGGTHHHTHENEPEGLEFSSFAELVQMVNRGLDQRKALPSWMKRATKYKAIGDEALSEGNKEKAFVCTSRAAIIVFEKILKHPDVDGLLNVAQRGTLISHAEDMLVTIQVLKKELEEEYARQAAIERVRKAKELEELERVNKRLEASTSALHRALHADFGVDKPLPQEPEPAPEPQPQPQPQPQFNRDDKLQAMRLELAAVSRPASPSSPEEAIPDHHWVNVPSPPISPRLDGALPTYQDVMKDILLQGSAGPGVDDERADGGSDVYNFQVVEPDASSTRAVTPLDPLDPPDYDPSWAVDADVDQKANLNEDVDFSQPSSPEHTPCPGRSSPRVRRSPSLAKSDRKSKSRSRSRGSSPQGEFRVVNPTVTREEEGLREVGDALDGVYRQLAALRKGGVKLPRDVRRKIDELKQFLL